MRKICAIIQLAKITHLELKASTGTGEEIDGQPRATLTGSAVTWVISSIFPKRKIPSEDFAKNTMGSSPSMINQHVRSFIDAVAYKLHNPSSQLLQVVA